jgi:hypothetical protein
MGILFGIFLTFFYHYLVLFQFLDSLLNFNLVSKIFLFLNQNINFRHFFFKTWQENISYISCESFKVSFCAFFGIMDC